MRKKLLVLGLTTIVGVSSISVTNILTDTSKVIAAQKDDDGEAEEDSGDDEISGGFTKGDIVVSPAKKTIKAGKSFNINLTPSADIDEEYQDLPDEEWEELLDDNIDGVIYRSTRSSVASVNSRGKVKGKKKGTAIIKTTVTFSDGSEGTYKTKVYVTK